MASTPVPRVTNPTPEVFWRDYVATRTPVVLTGTAAAAAFPARWDAASVAAALGEREFHFKRSDTNAHPNFRATTLGAMFAREQMTFRAFFDRLASAPEDERSRCIFTGDEHYVARQRDGAWIVNPDLEPLWGSVVIPPFVPEQRLSSAWAWFSGSGVRTWLHYDNNGCHNLNVQLHGQKRCSLFAPESLAELACFEPGDAVPAYNCSKLDVDAPDVRARLRAIPQFEATLETGDLLFIPAHWLHTFWHSGTYNANVNFWWKPETHEYPMVDDNAVARRERQLNSKKTY